MLVTCTTLWLQKHGNEPEEYEDAAYPTSAESTDQSGGSIDEAGGSANESGESTNESAFRCAVADGATETSFSGWWADILVRGFVNNEPLSVSRKKWQGKIPSTDMPWYVEEKAQAGAFAALVGLNLNEDKTWTAEAAGDSCLMHIRDGKMILSFPLDSAEAFNNRPSLTCSIETGDSEIERVQIAGEWQAGDRFLLLTDAIARWALQDGEPAISRLLSLENKDDLLTLTTEQRALQDDEGRPRLHNDDVTVMKVEVK